MSTVSDLDTWRLFFKIVSRGSIAKVSEEIGVEASSISRRINKLEKDLGVELFRRKGKQLVLTSAGSVAYSRIDVSFLMRPLCSKTFRLLEITTGT